MDLIVPIDRPTMAESVALGRALAPTGIWLGAGPRLLARGAPAVAALAMLAPVFADTRLGGDREGVASAARQIAAAGARRISVDARVGAATIDEVILAVEPFGTTVVLVLVPPESEDADRGRSVSRMAAEFAALSVEILGTPSDVGVVFQVAPERGVVVAGLDGRAAISDAMDRGAVAGMVRADAVDDREPAGSVAELLEAAGAGLIPSPPEVMDG